MKFLIITAIMVVWLGCVVEFAALAAAAFEVQNASSFGVLVMMLGWLGLTGFCGWKLRRSEFTGTPV